MVKDTVVGLIVDKIAEVVEFPDENILPPPSIGRMDKAQNQYVYGIGRVGDSVKLLLDPDKLLNDEDLSLIEEVNDMSEEEREVMKNLKIRTKLLIGFLMPVILMIINVFMENAAMRKLKQAEDTEAYIESYLVFSGILIVVSVLIIVIYAYFVIRTIRVSVSQLSTAAKDIALGKVDIKLV